MPKILVPLADGFEDIEAIAVIDILRRAGIEVVTAGAMGNIVTSRSKLRIHTDERLIDLDDFSKYDGVVLPGGSMGVEILSRNDRILRLVENFVKTGKLVGAICAAPSILAKLGLLKDRRATIHPGMEKLLDKPRGEPVVADGNVITSQAPGTAIAFALKLVEYLLGKQTAARLKSEVVA